MGPGGKNPAQVELAGRTADPSCVRWPGRHTSRCHPSGCCNGLSQRTGSRKTRSEKAWLPLQTMYRFKAFWREMREMRAGTAVIKR